MSRDREQSIAIPISLNPNRLVVAQPPIMRPVRVPHPTSAGLRSVGGIFPVSEACRVAAMDRCQYSDRGKRRFAPLMPLPPGPDRDPWEGFSKSTKLTW